jgi:hypothetical protein
MRRECPIQRGRGASDGSISFRFLRGGIYHTLVYGSMERFGWTPSLLPLVVALVTLRWTIFISLVIFGSLFTLFCYFERFVVGQNAGMKNANGM